VLLATIPFTSWVFGQAKDRQIRPGHSTSSELTKNPDSVNGTTSKGKEALLERLARDYLDSSSTKERKALITFCEGNRDRSLTGLAYFLIGFTDFQHRRFESAEEFLRKATSYATPIDDYSRFYWAEALSSLQRFEEAHGALAGYLDKFGQSPLKKSALSTFWEACLALNNPQEIIASVRSRQTDPEDPQSIYYLARAQELSGNNSEAIGNYQLLYYRFPLYAKNPTIPERLSNLLRENPELKVEIPHNWRTSRIETLVQKRQFRDVLQDLDFLAQANPTFATSPQFALWLGISQYGTGKYREALETLSRIASSDPEQTSQAGFYIAESYRKLENYPLFKQSVENLIEKFPKSSWSEKGLFSIGNYNLVKRNLDESTNCYQRIVELFPTGPHVADSHWRVSWNFYRLRDYKRAYDMFVEYMVRFPDGDGRLAAAYWAARCKQALGELAQALKIYQTLYQKFPQGYYGRLAQKQVALLQTTNNGNLANDPGITQIAGVLDNARTTKPVEVSRLLTTSWRTWPRVKALGLIQLFNEAAQELSHSKVAGEPAVVYFQTAQLYYQGKNFLPAVSAMRKVFPNYLDMPIDSLPQSVWKVFFPTNFAETIFREAQRQGVDPYLMLALIRQESGFDPLAISVANAHGLMQLLPSTARTVARGMKMRPPSTARLHDPIVNIRLGTKYFSDLVRQFDDQTDRALASYNAGEDRVEAWASEGDFADSAEFVETIPFSETRNYVKTIDRNYWFYKTIYKDR
jgi:soluble lytic murein transglycosylase